MNWILAAIAMLAASFSVPGIAQSHQGDPNFRSVVTGVKPALLGDGLEFEVKNFDDNINLVNRSGKTVEILGYDEELYVRIDPSGLVEVNLNSPSYYLNQDRYADVALPDRVDPKADPDWDEVDRSAGYSWHDHRSHYMGSGIPPQVEDESVKTKVFDYTIPITVGGKPADVQGTLTWVGSDSGFPALPFVALGVFVIAGLFGLRVVRKRRDREPATSTESESW